VRQDGRAAPDFGFTGDCGGEDRAQPRRPSLKQLDVREKYTRMVGPWATHAPRVNEGCHPNLCRLQRPRSSSAAMLEDPGWQDYLKESTGLLEELLSTMLPL